MTRTLAAICGLLLVAAAPGCSDGSDGPGPAIDSGSHWLLTCASSDQCGDALECLCGVCTAECLTPASCPLQSAVCAPPVDLEDLACTTGAEPAGLCLPACAGAGDCPFSDAACIDGICRRPTIERGDFTTDPAPISDAGADTNTSHDAQNTDADHDEDALNTDTPEDGRDDEDDDEEHGDGGDRDDADPETEYRDTALDIEGQDDDAHSGGEDDDAEADADRDEDAEEDDDAATDRS